MAYPCLGGGYWRLYYSVDYEDFSASDFACRFALALLTVAYRAGLPFSGLVSSFFRLADRTLSLHVLLQSRDQTREKRMWGFLLFERRQNVSVRKRLTNHLICD